MPTPLPTDPAQVEKITRTALVAKFAGIAGLPDANVIDHAVFISGETDFVRRFGVKVDATGKTEYRALFIVFTGFIDEDAGDDPVTLYDLIYTLRVVVSLADKRTDGTSSTDTFVGILLALRQRVLNERHLAGYTQLRCQNLKPRPGSFGLDEETGLTAHTIDLELRVNVTPSPIS